jgi:hypothetical protein
VGRGLILGECRGAGRVRTWVTFGRTCGRTRAGSSPGSRPVLRSQAGGSVGASSAPRLNSSSRSERPEYGLINDSLYEPPTVEFAPCSASRSRQPCCWCGTLGGCISEASSDVRRARRRGRCTDRAWPRRVVYRCSDHHHRGAAAVENLLLLALAYHRIGS